MLFKQLGGRCTILRVSLCLEMVPPTAEVPWSDVNRAVDLEHRGLVSLMCAVSNFLVEAVVCPCLSELFFDQPLLQLPEVYGWEQQVPARMRRRRQAPVLEQQSRRQGSLSPSPAG